MPFKLKLKRTKRYEVSSKNAYVVGVHMLDNSFLECTLSNDSKGGECLNSISQRVELSEVQYFGLRYVTKKLLFRWVDLDKPLKKQLDKFAHSPRLYFGVMYYVASAHKMLDDAARYQYFLQLKTDIIDGRLPCTPEQAVRFAAYSLQAEFGDHDPDRFTPELLKDFLLLPTTMTKDEVTLLELTKEVLKTHRRLQGVPVTKAEIQYIKEVQLLDGYGMDYYMAKDSSGKELYLGTSYAGVFARHLDGQPAVFFKWTEIANFSQSKKTLEIDTSKSSMQYQLEDPDTAKYMCHMCRLQQKFYKSNKNTLNSSLSDLSTENEAEHDILLDIQQTVPLQTDIPDVASSHSSLNCNQDIRLVQDCSQGRLPSQGEYSQSQQSLDTVSRVLPDVQQHYPEGVVGENIYSNADITSQHSSQIDHSYESRLAALPAYRPAPDYDSVMRQRMLQQTLQQQHQTDQLQQQQVLQQLPNSLVQLQPGSNIGNTQVYQQAQTIAYSQPEISGSQYNQTPEGQLDNYYANVFNEAPGYVQFRPGDRSSSQIIHPTYSSPELYAQLLAEDYNNGGLMGEALPYHYKPPPPYPRASNSTPDLAIQTVKPSLSESPDLVSRRNLGMADLADQSHLDNSVDNITAEFGNTVSINADNSSGIYMRPAEQADQSSLEENSPVIYETVDSPATVDDSMVVTPLKQSPQRVSGRAAQSPCEKKSKVQIRYVAPAQAPPHASSAEVATRRESFRRQLIANSPYFDPRASIRRSHRDAGGQSQLPTITDSKVPPGDKSKGSNPNSPNEAKQGSSKKPVEQTDSVGSTGSELEEILADEPPEEHRFSVGPLKAAALNGLSQSRPSMLGSLNDDTRAPKDERRKSLECQLEDGRVFVEFEKVFRRDPSAEFKVASMAENESRNRFRDVLPYEHNRVKLTPKKDNSTGYINASHIKMESGGIAWWFVAAQAPMPNTVADFWQLIWEYNVHVVAMLTDIVELGKQKCCQYWPVDTGEENKAVYGEFEVVLQYRSDSLYYVTNTICIRHKATKTERLVWHLQYTAWPDHGCPEDIFGFLGFLDEVESVQRMSESDRGGDKFPIVVHCSAGVGRTGVVILTAIMKSFLEHNQSIDLPKALSELRAQRLYMVQTVGQYSFVYKTLIQYLKNTRLI